MDAALVCSQNLPFLTAPLPVKKESTRVAQPSPQPAMCARDALRLETGHVGGAGNHTLPALIQMNRQSRGLDGGSKKEAWKTSCLLLS